MWLLLSLGDWGSPQQAKPARYAANQAEIEQVPFCAVTRPRLLLGRTRKRNVPKTLVYQDFLVKKINENDDVDDFVKRITFRYNNKYLKNICGNIFFDGILSSLSCW